MGAFRWPNEQVGSPDQLRERVRLHDTIIAALDADLATATRAAVEYAAACARLDGAIAEAMGGHVIKTVNDGRGVSCWSETAPPWVLRSVEQRTRERLALDAQRGRWLAETPSTPLDLSPGLSRALDPDAVRLRIDRTRQARGAVERQLAEALQDQLDARTAAEATLAEQPAPDGLRAEVARLRERLGL